MAILALGDFCRRTDFERTQHRRVEVSGALHRDLGLEDYPIATASSRSRPSLRAWAFSFRSV
jgi:hypothetical protein